MQDRYTCDIGDLGKLRLLHPLASTRLSISVNWDRNPDETHNSNVLLIGYLQKEQFRACDLVFWSVLGHSLVPASGRSQHWSWADAFSIDLHQQLVFSGVFPDVTDLASLRYYFCAIRPEYSKAFTTCVQQMMQSPWQYCFVHIL